METTYEIQKERTNLQMDDFSAGFGEKVIIARFRQVGITTIAKLGAVFRLLAGGLQTCLPRTHKK